MAHQYSRVGFKSSVEVNEVNLSLSYGGVEANLRNETKQHVNHIGILFHYNAMLDFNLSVDKNFFFSKISSVGLSCVKCIHSTLTLKICTAKAS